MMIKAWHFCKDDMMLNYGDNRHIVVGETLTVDADKLNPCNYGLHASFQAIDALNNAPGPIVCRVELGGKIIEQADKLCASERKVLWMADASTCLHLFACECARSVLDEKADPRSIAAIEAKIAWLAGTITDNELSAAWSAAKSAESAAWSAAKSAWSAAWSAAESAWSAAWSAAESAAKSATWSAAWSAAESAAKSATWSAAWSAARSAARSAAWSAAKSAQNECLEAMLNQLEPRGE